jgi:precorrin-6B methylase 2
MKHQDHVDLIRAGIQRDSRTWADFGSGSGAFTLALAELVGPGSVIYSVDRDEAALRAQARSLRTRYPQVTLHLVHADFTQPLDLPALDGMVMANALHFVSPGKQVEVIRRLKGYLKPGGRLIVVEYNVDRGNLWVPHPLSFTRWQEKARQAGFEHTRLLGTAPSSFLNEFYSAENW